MTTAILTSNKTCRVEGSLGFSYATAIVKVDHDLRKIFVNFHKFSQTTSKHRTKLVQFFIGQHPDFVVVQDDIGKRSY